MKLLGFIFGNNLKRDDAREDKKRSQTVNKFFFDNLFVVCSHSITNRL